ncbi:EAL domain-containing protein, partial [Aeromonas caviae]|uniref:EAL domain-containing protein n=1 Tax=Aeromonas caviae TaxID=648 RepID=UPI0013A5B67E
SHIIENLIDLANRLNQVIVAEGGETREQAEYLASRGVHLLQGDLFGKAVPFDVFIKEHNLTDLDSSGRASERVLNPATPA